MVILTVTIAEIIISAIFVVASLTAFIVATINREHLFLSISTIRSVCVIYFVIGVYGLITRCMIFSDIKNGVPETIEENGKIYVLQEPQTIERYGETYVLQTEDIGG